MTGATQRPLVEANEAALVPHPARLLDIAIESPDTRTFVLRPDPPLPAFDAARPGQFAMLSLFGVGEAAFTLSALPGHGADAGTVVLTVRSVGALTTRLFSLEPRAWVGVRGPYGRGFSALVPEAPTLYVAGGCGLAPIKAAIEDHLARPGRGTVGILYGARNAESRIFRSALERWQAIPDVVLLECLEHPGPNWRGLRGAVGEHVAAAGQTSGAVQAVVCGPPAMITAALEPLRRNRLDPARIFAVLERYVKCAVGHCGHCYINHRYLCVDGPVFSLAELAELPEALPATASAHP